MTTTRSVAAALPVAGSWRDRVEAADWDTIGGELDSYGCALIGPLLSADEAAGIAALYGDDSRFRSTVDMRRYRFGEGEYRYFAEPFPDAVVALKHALYPRLLPIARDWWTRLGRQVPVARHPRRVAGHVSRRRADQVDSDPAQVRSG